MSVDLAGSAAEIWPQLGPALSRARWFPRGSGEARWLGARSLASDGAAWLAFAASPSGVVIQVPLVVRLEESEPGPGARGELLARIRVDGSAHDVREGCGDEVFASAWLRAAGAEPPCPLDCSRVRILGMEQSNTSVVLPGDGRSGLLKVFRQLSAGPNPDVETPIALRAVGFEGVPEVWGALKGPWPIPGGEAAGALGVLSEYVDDATDGFELACASAGRGEPFDAAARRLGVRLAELHAALREAFPASQIDADLPALAAQLSARARWAMAEVPELAELTRPIEARYRALASLRGGGRRQRVHGDLHLGQLLAADDTWLFLDFEGEPLRPAAERVAPDYPARDLAGLLRSFDYAAAKGGAPVGWSAAARRALVESYRQAVVDEPGAIPELVDAFLLDKALYEAVYESRSRPDWLEIPLSQVRALA